MLDKGWEARGQKEVGWGLTKDGFVIKFDIRIATPKGYVWVGYFRRSSAEITAAPMLMKLVVYLVILEVNIVQENQH